MSELTVTPRPLREVTLSKEDTNKETFVWLETNATAPNRNNEDYFMWIPPSKSYIKAEYGEDIPKVIEEILTALVESHQSHEDHGYLLLSFV